MNPILKEFLEKKQAEAAFKKENKRKATLCELGLVDVQKSTRIYLDCYEYNAERDAETGLYYRDVAAPIDVTDEEYELICQYKNKATQGIQINNYNEKTLETIATVVLFIGIIGAIIMAITITHTTISGEFSSSKETIINPMGIVSTITTLLSSIIAWGVLRVICNISNSLKEINSKAK